MGTDMSKIINGYKIKPKANLKDAWLEGAKIFGHVIGKKQENE